MLKIQIFIYFEVLSMSMKTPENASISIDRYIYIETIDKTEYYY